MLEWAWGRAIFFKKKTRCLWACVDGAGGLSQAANALQSFFLPAQATGRSSFQSGAGPIQALSTSRTTSSFQSRALLYRPSTLRHGTISRGSKSAAAEVCVETRLYGIGETPNSNHPPLPSSNHISRSPISFSPCHLPTNSFRSIIFKRFALTLKTKFGADGVPFSFSLSFRGFPGSCPISASPNVPCIKPG